ncbi:peptidyl-prolyl cis-trans isomerase FKBP43 [Nicotiana tomentosiformis]|uniref:peptidyl-prolyl cis-trans isomerase FKBP43 n=1 Tax=Nicotiana tomentosiformis TaxID=4098 RepID=UPI00388C3780
MCHSQDRTKEKKRKIENQENRCDSNISSSQLEMENQSSLATPKEITENATSPHVLTLSDGVTFEVLMKGKQDGKAASIGKQVKIYFTAKLRGTGCVVGSNIGEAPHKFRLGDKNMVKGLNIGIEALGKTVGLQYRQTHGSSMKLNWLIYVNKRDNIQLLHSESFNKSNVANPLAEVVM